MLAAPWNIYLRVSFHSVIVNLVARSAAHHALNPAPSPQPNMATKSAAGDAWNKIKYLEARLQPIDWIRE